MSCLTLLSVCSLRACYERQRMISALDEVGGAVLLGGMTTFVGVLPLAFASSFIYRVFFRLFFAIVSLGILHGFVVVPCLIVCIPPAPHVNPKAIDPKKSMITVAPRKSPNAPLARANNVEATGEFSL